MTNQILPPAVFKFLDSRMEKPTYKKGEVILPFDYIRASVNLVVASILIASATSLKLPLSTTYVTFMVAMGSSFADGAWDRESAVYRISGVLTVIGGWFFTAFSAFTLCALVAFGVFYGESIAVIGLMLFVSFMLIRSNFFGKKEKIDNIENLDVIDRNVICARVNSATDHYLTETIAQYHRCIDAFLNEDLKELKNVRNSAIALQDDISRRRGEYYQLALEGGEEKVDRDARHYYYRVFTNLKELGHGLRSVLGTAYNHVDNNHRVFKGALRTNLEEMIADLHSLEAYLKEFVQSSGNNDLEMSKRQNQSITLINRLQLELLQRIDEENLSLRGSELYLNYLQFSRDLINRFSLIALLQHELNEKVKASQG